MTFIMYAIKLKGFDNQDCLIGVFDDIQIALTNF